MKTAKQVWICLLCNIALTFVTVIVMIIFKDPKSIYFRIGPHADLFVVSICVDTWTKWMTVVLFVGLSKIGDVLINEIGSPILGFNVYNPDKEVITEFTKNELQLLANSMFIVNGIRQVLMFVVNVAQVDMAMIGLLLSESASLFTIRYLLNKKTFTKGQVADRKNHQVDPEGEVVLIPILSEV